MHFSNVHFVLCQIFVLNHPTPPFHAFFPPLSIVSLPSELKWTITSPKKGQAMQRFHEEQSARSKGARLSPLEKILGRLYRKGVATQVALTAFGFWSKMPIETACSTIETFRRSYRDPPTRTYPSGTDPPEPLCPDLIRTRFRPDSDLKRVISGPNQVEIRSKSGPNQVRAEGFSWVGAGGVGPGGRVPVAPRKVSILQDNAYFLQEQALMLRHPTPHSVG